MSVMTVKSTLWDYQVNIGPVNEPLESLVKLSHKAFVVDENVWQIYADKLLKVLPESEVIVFPAKEELKTLEGVQQVFDQLIDRSAKKNLTLVTIGGGILQDVTGFAASTLYRGIDWILIPTTLLAQADSCIGSKTSLNYKGYKNLIGTFFPPKQVWIDPAFVQTLQTQDFYSGLGEVIKLHIMGGDKETCWIADHYPAICARENDVLEEAICHSLDIKNDYIANDEFDRGRRNLLNYGHCFGHALEAATDFCIPHGQAVILGMILANAIAVKRGLLSRDTYTFLNQSLLIPSVKVDVQTDYFSPEPIIEAMGKDKKRVGAGLVLVMLTDHSQMKIVQDLGADEVRFSLDQLNDLRFGQKVAI